MSSHQNAAPQQYPTLDGLRFLAFAMVFFFLFSAGPDHPTLSMLQAQGWIGVEVFFTLSAFLLFGLFEKEVTRTGRISISLFYARRLLRIYPLMMLFAIAMLILYGSANADAYGWLLGLASFVGNFIYWFPEHAKSVPNTGHLWSLSYEFQIYLILPLLFLVYRAVGKRAFLMALLCALPICLVGRAAFALSGISIQPIYMTPLLRPESTIAGLLIAMGVTKKLPIWTVATAFACSAIGLVTLPDLHTSVGSVIAFVTAGLFAGSLLHLTLYAKNLGTVLQWRPLAYLGQISFGLYVFHLWAFGQGMSLLRMTSIPENYGTRCLAGMAFCIAVATVSYYCLERPILRQKPRQQASPSLPGSVVPAE
ncbi:acyltransferase [Mesorhizobium sp. M7A.F.Ca.CA.004.09.1.2]|uniref:acyltransferase family protein n=1 Tax=Mesorhizobium sp. M7A.F.Ca.CA.004.09.1.2 TaxID=2496695 RepID=UPI000FCA7814|nr:acyltransferase [Mesorhizobium sp. M7A.F.Ca.CA.004.09.1.2]RVA56840.1 acyltransferase [Mesorhizobium sp. M7A.F.Ca.CA.004.09.1.2]